MTPTTARMAKFGALTIVGLLSGCANMPQLRIVNTQQQNANQSTPIGQASTRQLAFAPGQRFNPLITVVVPAGTCDTNWYIEGYKGAYPMTWNRGVNAHPELHAQPLITPTLPPAEASAQMVGPQLGVNTDVKGVHCATDSYLAGKHAGNMDAQQAIYTLSSRNPAR